MAANAYADPDVAEEEVVEQKSLKAITALLLKRTYDMFAANHGQKVPLDEEAQKVKIACKVSFPADLPHLPPEVDLVLQRVHRVSCLCCVSSERGPRECCRSATNTPP